MSDPNPSLTNAEDLYYAIKANADAKANASGTLAQRAVEQVVAVLAQQDSFGPFTWHASDFASGTPMSSVADRLHYFGLVVRPRGEHETGCLIHVTVPEPRREVSR